MAAIEAYERIVEKFNNLTAELSNPNVTNNIERYKDLSKERASLEEKVAIYTQYQKLSTEKEESLHLIETEKNEEMKELANAELMSVEKELAIVENKLKTLLVPVDPRDEKNVIMEIRAGTGGDESAIFAADLFRMYSRYAEGKGWVVEVTDYNQIGLGGYKEIIFMIKGDKVYSRMKFESGIHRVQRVPVTESSGRIHTSAATVAVLAEVDETEINIKADELRIDVYRASGAGGQHVNKTESAVRITHLPSGLVVTCQDEKSQHKNRERAMKVLRARLYEQEEEKRNSAISEERKQQVGSGDRSGKIRTYNFSQNRLTDHRIGLTLYKLDRVLDGDLDDVIDPLAEDDNKQKIAAAHA